MMDIVSVAIGRAKFETFDEVINLAFQAKSYNPSRNEWFTEHSVGVNIDEIIRRGVVDARVAIDLNLCSGVEVVIKLGNVAPILIDPWNRVYKIPKHLTGGRSITAVYALSFGQGDVIGSYQPQTQGSSAALDAASGIMQASGQWTQVQTAYLTIIGENTILLNNVGVYPGQLFLRCQVTHEPNFANIPPAYYEAFGDLVVLATKAYIHRQLLIKLDEGSIKAGAQLSRIREVVDGYADSNQLYREYIRDNWRAKSHMADGEKNKRSLRTIVGSRR